mgnify:CR=1 FL=1
MLAALHLVRLRPRVVVVSQHPYADGAALPGIRASAVEPPVLAAIPIANLALLVRDAFLERLARETGGRVSYVGHGGELADAYRAIASGVLAEPHVIDRVTDVSGDGLYEAPRDTRMVRSAGLQCGQPRESADAMVDMNYQVARAVRERRCGPMRARTSRSSCLLRESEYLGISQDGETAPKRKAPTQRPFYERQ